MRTTVMRATTHLQQCESTSSCQSLPVGFEKGSNLCPCTVRDRWKQAPTLYARRRLFCSASPHKAWYLVQMIYSGGVATRDLRFLRLRAVRQDLIQYLPSSRESGFRMRIVRTPLEVVYSNNMPVLYPQGVFLKAHENVTMK